MIFNGNVAVRATIFQAHKLQLLAARSQCQNKARGHRRGPRKAYPLRGQEEHIALPGGAGTALWG